MRDLEEETKSK